jgi:hypothetical protein
LAKFHLCGDTFGKSWFFSTQPHEFRRLIYIRQCGYIHKERKIIEREEMSLTRPTFARPNLKSEHAKLPGIAAIISTIGSFPILVEHLYAK